MRGAIFDLDGTLLDSMGVWEQIDVDFLAARGLAVPPDYLQEIAHLGFRAAAEYTIARFGLQDTLEDLLAEWNEMARIAYRDSVPLRPYAEEYLRLLKGSGVRLAVATASYEGLFGPALKRLGIFELFDAFVTVEEVERGKGFPDIYLRAAEKIGLEPTDCTVFEDIYEGIRGAKAGGFATVAVYEPYSAASADKLRREADAYIHDFSELLSRNT